MLFSVQTMSSPEGEHAPRDPQPSTGRHIEMQSDRTQAPQGRRPLRAMHPYVMADLIARVPLREIARRYGAAMMSVSSYADRHAAEVEAGRRGIDVAVQDYQIAHKVNRIRDLQAMADQVDDYVDEHGLTDEVTRYDPKTGAVIGVDKRFSAGLVQQYRGLRRDAAEELGQLDKQSAGVTVVIRNIVGIDPDELG